MPRYGSLSEMADFFTAVSLGTEKVSKKAMTKAARLIRDEAKRVLGTYDYDWAPLAASTVERKATGDSPGLETGDMKRSIKMSVGDKEFTVGSNSPKALWFELGTSRMPPRSFLAGAAMAKLDEVHDIMGKGLLSDIFEKHHSPDFEDDWSYDGED